VKKALFVVVFGLLVAGCSQLQPDKPYKKKSDLPYGTDPAQKFDVYEPIEPYAKHDKHHPTVFVIHGGSWYIGDKDQLGKQVARALCPEGYAVVSINYRLAPKHVWPAQLEDVQACYAHVMSSTWLPIDPNRMAVLGHSAGAMLTSHLAFRGDGDKRPYVKTAVLLAGHFAYDEVSHDAMPGHVGRLFGMSPKTKHSELPADKLRDISSTHLARREVDALLMHPFADGIASVEHSERLYQALLKAGSQGSDFKYVDSGDHNNFWLKDDNTHVRDIVRFLDARL
jgi:acetyl esterase/lipase